MSAPTDQSVRFGVTVGARCDFPGADAAEAGRRADEIERRIANVMSEFGVSDRGPLVVVWESGPIAFDDKQHSSEDSS